MEAVSVAAATAAVNFLVGRLGDILTEELKLLGGLRDDVQDLKSELTSMGAFLQAVEQQQEDDLQMKVWVDQVMDLSRDTGAIIDRFNTLVGRLDEDSSCRCFCRPAHKLWSPTASHEIAAEIQRIKTRVREVRERHVRYCHPKSSPGPSSCVAIPAAARHQQHDPRLAALFVEEAELVGIDESKDKLIGWLLADNAPQPRVISVVGMGGLGKTTLVKKVYDSSRVSGGRFQSRAWITVSQSLDIMGVLKGMIRQLFSNPPQGTETADQTELIQILRGYLQCKRYVIVLDDIWNIPDWENIKHALPASSLGSRIMVTTRIESVAYSCSAQCHEYVYKLEPLSQEQSWELFCRRVFYSTEKGCPPHLTDLSEGIVKRCGGLPLALVTIGGLLASKPNKTREEWRKLHLHLGPEMETNPSLDGMKRILNLSYEDLPSDLKPAFLYLSIFPEDYSIDGTRLVRRWIAEGLVSKMRSKTLEEVANEYFYEFLNRSMIQPSEINLRGTVKSCRVHDVMHEVILTMSTGLTVLDETNPTMEPEHHIRHLTVHASSSLEEISENTSTIHIQSLTMFGNARPSLISSKMERLTVLDLQGCKLVKDHHIKMICKFHQLKYLNLRLTSINHLPNSLGELPNLQTLDVREIKKLTLPTKIEQLRQLRNFLCSLYDHLYIPYKGHIAAQLPRGVGNLKALQMLAHVSLKFCSASHIMELAQLSQLRKLGVVGLTIKNAEEFCAALEKLSSCLRSLSVWLDTELEGFRFLDSIRSPPLHLLSLKFGGHVNDLPHWVTSLHNVTKIALQGTGIEGDVLVVFRNLPSLMELHLDSFDSMMLTISSDGFRSLKLLCLKGDYYSLDFGQGAMPNLEKLQLRRPRCHLNSIKHLAGLREVVAVDVDLVDELDLQNLKEPVAAHPNKPKLIIMASGREIQI